MNRLRAVLLLAVIGACVTSAHRNTQVALAGVVRDSLTDTPLVGAQVFLTEDTTVLHGPPRRWPRGVVTDSVGRFVFHDVQPGSYVLQARFIGFSPRWVRVVVPVARGEPLTLRLHPATIRTGFGLSDPTKVVKNRERVSEWTCRRSDPEEIEATRQEWIGTLSSREPVDWDSLLVATGLSRDSIEIARMARHVTNPEVCRRAGDAYDRQIGATDIHFLVIEVGPILIVVDGRRDATLVLDRDYRVLTMFVAP